MQVRFNEVDEFIEEVSREFKGAQIFPKPILRLTGLLKETSTPLRNLYLCATILNLRGQIVLLEKYCGGLWAPGSPEDKKTQDRYAEFHSQIEKAVEELPLEVRHGVYEEEANARAIS